MKFTGFSGSGAKINTPTFRPANAYVCASHPPLLIDVERSSTAHQPLFTSRIFDMEFFIGCEAFNILRTLCCVERRMMQCKIAFTAVCELQKSIHTQLWYPCHV
uniref:Uncharacterized protein n=1 Tax=Steinernema glaseri TaxID=37863 RepID=A0A1I7YG26_9BILA